MKQEGKKYTIRESELKEIIREMVLTEIYEPDAYVANFNNGQPPRDFNTYDAVKGLANGIPNMWNGLVGKLQGSDYEAAKWVGDVLGPSQNGASGPDWLPNLNTMERNGGPGFGKGNNYDAHEVFRPQDAVRGLLSRATPQFIKGKNGKYCARYVRLAMEDGGLTPPWGMLKAAQNACGYVQILPANGWVEIPQNQAGQPGDVLVIDSYTQHPKGHIAMCAGNGKWAADYVHRAGNIYGLADTPPANRVHFYRYTNISNQPYQKPQNNNSKVSDWWNQTKEQLRNSLRDLGVPSINPGN